MSTRSQVATRGWLLACFGSWAVLMAALALYTVGVSMSGDRLPAAVLLSVFVGWPILLVGAAFALRAFGSRSRGAPHWAPGATGASLVLFTVGCVIAGSLLAAGSLPGMMLWLGLPTAGAVLFCFRVWAR